MEWTQLISAKRFGLEHYFKGGHDRRSDFERDYDRLIFSPSFRRLQNKTQVFPLPGSVFVHNRLTHSLEVSCVGRSLGYAVLERLKDKYGDDLLSQLDNIPTIVSTACLAHDLGNPPFGHSGETAISTFFSEGKGKHYKDDYGIAENEWSDFTNFDGNANAFRLLTHAYIGRREGGFAMTYSALASIVKYPYSSLYCPKGKSKFGYFASEKLSYEKIALELGMQERDGIYDRYPLVYLVEAADDICYQLMDLEDACKLHIISFDEVKQLIYKFFTPSKIERSEEIFSIVKDSGERLSYLRSTAIGLLVEECARVFCEHEREILNGEFKGGLMDSVDNVHREVYKEISRKSVASIYNSQSVLDVELAGYKIITDLLEIFVGAVFEPEKVYSKQLLKRVPGQYDVLNETSAYQRILAVLDFMSSMTDVYALDLYRKISGASLPTV